MRIELSRPGAHGAQGAQGAQGALWRALAIFRFVSLLFVAIQVGRNYQQYAHPAGAVCVVVAMACWTVFVSAVQPALPDFPRGGRWRPRGPAVLMAVADLTVAIVALLATELVDTHQRIAAGAQTLPGAWTAAAVLGAAIAGGARLGLTAALLLSSALFVERRSFAATTTSSATLLVLAGLVVGYLATTALEAEQEVSRVRAFEAARAERDRLARAIHDGALQTLALIAREAHGMDRAAIAELAAQQEGALRSHINALVLSADAPPSPDVDLRLLLRAAETAWPRRQVTLAMPASPVMLAHETAQELTAAAWAALENADQHAGGAANVWILLEDDADAVLVTVRDDGVGMAMGRVSEAGAAGRFGLANSVIGRMRAIGGDASVSSAPGAGVEVELRVPRR